jgi:hypothetical protein
MRDSWGQNNTLAFLISLIVLQFLSFHRIVILYAS